MANLVKSIQTIIDAGQLGSLVVDWDVNAYLNAPDTHPDNSSRLSDEFHEVHAIGSIELQIFDKQGINFINAFHGKELERLKDLLLEDVESERFITVNQREVAA
jgi:hypothetical protein